MGEIFRRTIPSRSLNWTGERLVTSMTGAIEDEHLHRYFVARELCRGKNVLDVASGEGYGTALLAQTALSVIGVEIDPNSVDHANSSYVSSNLTYLLGDGRNLPLESNSIDVVVSFETLEHISEQDRFLAEVARVLKPEGFFFISTPDPEVYSGPGMSPNPYHVRELTFSEFRDMLGKFFEQAAIYRQRTTAGSTIWPDGVRCNAPACIFDQRSPDTFEAHRNLPRAPYLLALASNGPLPCFSGSFFLHSLQPLDPETAAELERLRGAGAALSQAQAEIERLRMVLIRTREEHSQLQSDNSRLAATEIRLRGEIEELSCVGDKNRGELNNVRQELHNATLLSRQQALVAQRLQQEIQHFQTEKQRFQEERHRLQEESQRRYDEFSTKMQNEVRESHMQAIATQRELESLSGELSECRASLARSEQLVNELSGLIVPVWFRKLLPASIRSMMRRIKKLLTS